MTQNGAHFEQSEANSTNQVNFRQVLQGTFDFFHFVPEQPILCFFFVFKSFVLFFPSILKTIILWTIHFVLPSCVFLFWTAPFYKKNSFVLKNFVCSKKTLPISNSRINWKMQEELVHRKPVYSCDLTK